MCPFIKNKGLRAPNQTLQDGDEQLRRPKNKGQRLKTILKFSGPLLHKNKGFNGWRVDDDDNSWTKASADHVRNRASKPKFLNFFWAVLVLVVWTTDSSLDPEADDLFSTLSDQTTGQIHILSNRTQCRGPTWSVRVPGIYRDHDDARRLIRARHFLFSACLQVQSQSKTHTHSTKLHVQKLAHPTHQR